MIQAMQEGRDDGPKRYHDPPIYGTSDESWGPTKIPKRRGQFYQPNSPVPWWVKLLLLLLFLVAAIAVWLLRPQEARRTNAPVDTTHAIQVPAYHPKGSRSHAFRVFISHRLNVFPSAPGGFA